MNSNRTFTLLLASALSPLMALSSLNGHIASGKTVRTSYPLEGKDSIVTSVDGKIVSIEIVQKEDATKNAGKKEKTTETDTAGITPGARLDIRTAELDHQYRMTQLENELEAGKIKLESLRIQAQRDSDKYLPNPYKPTIIILLICIGLPLLLAFGFLSYRLRLKNKRNSDFEKFLIDLAKSGQPLSPELIDSLRANQVSRTKRRTPDTRTNDPGFETAANSSFLNDEKIKVLEKETFRYCSRRACLAIATLLLIFWALISRIDLLATLLFIPFLIFLFQGGARFFDFYIEKRYTTPAQQTETDPMQSANAQPETVTDPQPAQPLPAETAASDTPVEPTR